MTTNRLLSFVALVVILLGLAAAFVLGGVRSQPAAAGESAKAGIVVSGTGRVEAAPDQLEFTVGVRRRAESVDEALGKANDLVRKVRKALIAAGVQNRRIQTTDLSIEPTYSYANNEERITGYQAGQQLTVRVHRIADAGKVIGAAAKAGGNAVSVHDIRMVLANRDAVMAEARKEAIADARQNAEQFAEAAGRKLGRLVFVEQADVKRQQDPSINASLSSLDDAAFAAKAAPISVGQEELTVKVSVRWALG